LPKLVSCHNTAVAVPNLNPKEVETKAAVNKVASLDGFTYKYERVTAIGVVWLNLGHKVSQNSENWGCRWCTGNIQGVLIVDKIENRDRLQI